MSPMLGSVNFTDFSGGFIDSGELLLLHRLFTYLGHWLFLLFVFPHFLFCSETAGKKRRQPT